MGAVFFVFRRVWRMRGIRGTVTPKAMGHVFTVSPKRFSVLGSRKAGILRDPWCKMAGWVTLLP